MDLDIAKFVLPEKVERVPDTYSENYGEFIVQPLERGFGITLGNALRRVVLSSLEGAAMWGLHIDGVLNEFSTIPGVVEDVPEIISNLKQLVFILDKDLDSAILKLSVSSAGDITAENVTPNPGVEILNPEIHLFSLQKNRKVDIDIYIRRDRGYVPAEQHPKTREQSKTVGFIPVDAAFNPVLRANFVVENTRVGQRTDYDKLTMQITTDGTINPEEAIGYTARLLRKHFEYFLSFEEPMEVDRKAADVRRDRIKDLLARSVEELELSVRSSNCLKASNICTLGELVQKSESEMLKYRNFGKKSLGEISTILEKHGLRFGMKVIMNEKGEVELSPSEEIGDSPDDGDEG